jgi:propanediol dehydratase small subunit
MTAPRDSYPLAETAPETVRAKSGRPLTEITLEAVLAGEIGMEDLAIDPATLDRQAAIARAAGRATLARNFERAADLVPVPDAEIMRAYELLRPGRAKSRAELDALAAEFRDRWGATRIAEFIAEAAEVYERRGLFKFRF